QSTPLANPFLAPDRVPPPATGTLAPGTAQPYYGDLAPAVPPTTTMPPAGTVTPQPTYPPPQTAPVTPPGGWSQPAATPYGTPMSGPAAVLPGDNTAIQIAPD